MVRYGRLPFRLLCRKYGVDVVYTPMFVAEGFTRSQKARDADFTTTDGDSPLIVQFAGSFYAFSYSVSISHSYNLLACDPIIFTKAASIVSKSCAGVDLNCGCPQKFAIVYFFSLYRFSDGLCPVVWGRKC